MYQVPASLALKPNKYSIVLSRVTPDEDILWVGQPTAWRILLKRQPILTALLLFGYSISPLLIPSVPGDLLLQPWVWIPIFLVAAAFGAQQYLVIRSFVYVLTTKRMFVIGTNILRIPYFSFTPVKVEAMNIKHLSDGKGNISFYAAYETKSGRQLIRKTHLRGVENAEDLHSLIQRLFGSLQNE